MAHYLSASQNNFTLDDVSHELAKLYPSAVNPAIIQNALAALEAEQPTTLPQLEFQDLTINEKKEAVDGFANQISMAIRQLEGLEKINQVNQVISSGLDDHNDLLDVNLPKLVPLISRQN